MSGDCRGIDRWAVPWCVQYESERPGSHILNTQNEPTLYHGGYAMSDYSPEYRRPIADVFRGTAHGVVGWCVRRNVHPDAISYLSIVFSAIAAVCFIFAKSQPILLLVAPVFCYIRLWCNMLDGMVALASGKASHRGEILNDLPDRVSDALVFIGIAHSGLCLMWLGYWGAIAALLVAYVGILGQAVGVQREFSGIMSKPWRMVVVHAGAWASLGMLWWGEGGSIAGLSAMDWAIVIILLGCIQTIVIRLQRIMRSLKAKAIAKKGQ